MPLTSPSIAAAERETGLVRMADFASKMGADYARTRNFDYGPDNRSNISCLSPHTRHRLVQEEELVATALRHHSATASEKFVQEVVWRSYWKGWLEQRPDVWFDWLAQVEADKLTLSQHPAQAQRHAEALAGETGIACFDFWSRELVETGYLHNHARMWFASIWVHTLELPWSLGAAFFLHHLLDGDPASNTLSWRWISGLHTKGKTYLARADNIEKFTAGRFQPQTHQLSTFAKIPDDDAEADRVPLPFFMPPQTDMPTALLITVEDCSAEIGLLSPALMKTVTKVATVATSGNPAGIGQSPMVIDFRAQALRDAAQRFETASGIVVTHLPDTGAVSNWANKSGAEQLVLAHLPVSETKTALAATLTQLDQNGMRVTSIARDWDKAIWPHATAGFFKVKKKIPTIFNQLGIL